MDKLDKIAKEIAFAGRCKHDVSKDAQEFWDNTAEASRSVFLRQAEAAIKALPDMVQPLEWTKGVVDVAKTEDGVKYIICSRSGSNRDKWAFWSDNDPYSRQVCDSEEGARKAAHDYRVKQILKALGVSDE